jgi:hypothetical protein
MRMSLLLVAVVLVLRLRRLTKRLDPLFGLMMIDGDIRFCLDLVSYSSRSIMNLWILYFGKGLFGIPAARGFFFWNSYYLVFVSRYY